jgi:hypothetical protein
MFVEFVELSGGYNCLIPCLTVSYVVLELFGFEVASGCANDITPQIQEKSEN